MADQFEYTLSLPKSKLQEEKDVIDPSGMLAKFEAQSLLTGTGAIVGNDSVYKSGVDTKAIKERDDRIKSLESSLRSATETINQLKGIAGSPIVDAMNRLTIDSIDKQLALGDGLAV